MINKRATAWMLLVVMVMNIVPIQTYAYVQNGLNIREGEGIKSVTVSHMEDTVLGNRNIMPDVNVEWAPPEKNTVDADHTDNNSNSDGLPEGYHFELTDVLSGTRTQSQKSVKHIAGKTAYIEKVQDYIDQTESFQNGKLYKLRIIPYHVYYKMVNGVQQSVNVTPPTTIVQPEKYFMTDFNTQLNDNEGKLEVIWEYIAGATYELVYTEGNISSKSEMFNVDGSAKPGTVKKTLTDAEARALLSGKKVKYTIADAKPGQLYSACVTVKDIVNAKVPIRIDKIQKNTDNPKIAQETTSVVLKVFNTAKNKIRLEWNVGDWLIIGASLTKTTIYEKLEGSSEYKSIGMIENNGTDPGYFNYREPKANTWYYVEFLAEQGGTTYKTKTKEVLYIPEELREKPLQPQIPKPFSKAINVEEVDIKDYLVKNDDIDKNNPNLINNTFHSINKDGLDIQLTWGAPFKVNSDNKTVVEHEMAYDIWVVEDKDQLDDPDVAPIALGPIYEGQKDNIIYKKDGTTIVGFKYNLKEYTKLDGKTAALLPNKTYYIQLVAKRSYGQNMYEKSDPAIAIITLDKNGDIFAPPVLAKPPLKLEGVTTTTATLKWLETWYEIMSKDPMQYDGDADESYFSDMWNSRVFTYTQGGVAPYIRFKMQEGFKEHILKTKQEVEAVEKIVDTQTATISKPQEERYYYNNYTDREVTLGKDTKYEVKAILYDEIAQKLNINNQTPSGNLTIDKWIVQNESNTTEGWTTVNVTDTTDGGLAGKQYIVEGLTANTRYVILVRAYRVLVDGTKLQQTFPSYVIATTLSEHDAPETIPTVPILNPSGVTDESVSVWWIYNKDFDYEIVYSKVEDPSKATVWDFEISSVVTDKNYVSSGAKASVTITGLMPDTTYNVWIRAKQKKGDKVSSWSNPVTQTTDTMGTPDVPRGLGPAAYQSILELGLDFKPVASDYITVEWLKDVNDVKGESANGKSRKTYSYVLEFADNPEFLDALSVTASDEAGGSEEDAYNILAKNRVRFNGLIANRPYYVRVKAVLTFKDEEANREIVKESAFTNGVRILTKTSNDEYDGGDNGNIIIYPEPIIQDYTNNIWTWEIVDRAKVISEIQKNKQYYYTITLENYKDKYDAEVRRIKMPKSVMDTLINQSMELRIVTNIGSYEIPAKALSYYSKQHSASDTVQIDLTRAMNHSISSILRGYPEIFIKGEKLDLLIKGDKKATPIKKLDGYIKIKLKLDATLQYKYKDYYTYTYNYDKAAWAKEEYTIETLTDTYLTYKTAYTGLYAIYEKEVTSTSSTNTYSMSKLANAYGINGLGTVYYSKDRVHAGQFVQLLLGIAQNKSQIDLTTAVSRDMFSQAKTASIYISSNRGAVTEEQAIAGIVKLYELKSGYKLKPSSTQSKGVSAEYKDSVAKAYALGLIDGISPQAHVTYATLCDWILQVTQ